jgi:hypothetical protein
VTATDTWRTVDATPGDEGRAITRLLDDCARVARLGDVRPDARDRLEAALGAEFARWLLRALAGDHRLPARTFVD